MFEFIYHNKGHRAGYGDQLDNKTIAITCADDEFSGNYVAEDVHNNLIALYKEEAWHIRLFWLAIATVLAGVVFFVARNIGYDQGLEDKPAQYVETVVPQTHTVIDYEVVEVAQTFCPTDDSCKASYVNGDGEGPGGEWIIEEVTP